MGTKMRRSKHDKVIAGVCGGIADYLNIDPTIIRLGFVFATFFGGIGPIAYIVGIFVMPEKEGYKPNNFFEGDSDMKVDDNIEYYDSDKDFTEVMGDSMDSGEPNSKKSSTFLGLSLILLGVMFLFKQFIPKINFVELVPVMLVVIGLLIVFRNGRKQK